MKMFIVPPNKKELDKQLESSLNVPLTSFFALDLPDISLACRNSGLPPPGPTPVPVPKGIFFVNQFAGPLSF